MAFRPFPPHQVTPANPRRDEDARAEDVLIEELDLSGAEDVGAVRAGTDRDRYLSRHAPLRPRPIAATEELDAAVRAPQVRLES